MQTIELVCHQCKTTFYRPLKEHTRQQKKGLKRTFCSRKCAALANPYRGPGRPQYLQADNRRDEYTGFRHFISRAKSRDPNTNLTLPYLKQVWEEQNGKCRFTGVVLSLRHGKNQNPCYQASLDRIDSNQGYCIGNIQFVCVPINCAKGTMPDSAIIEWIQTIKSMI